MPSLSERPGKQYWRSLDDLANTPDFQRFVEQEFTSYAPELLRSPNRRQFLKLMGASLALAGLTGCRWPKENIVPQSRRSPNRVPGIPVHYATAWELGGIGAGLLVTSFDGRPTKIEGNPLHPLSNGATDSWVQASILELYDPDRSTGILSHKVSDHHQSADAFRAAAAALFAAHKSAAGKGLYILSEASDSPSLDALRGQFTKVYPQAKWFEYEPLGLLETERAGTQLAFGAPHRSQLALDAADVILALDADLLMTHPAATRYARDWASGRRAETKPEMNRLYAVESAVSITGANADFRYPIRHRHIAAAALQIASELVKAGVKLPASAQTLGGMLQSSDGNVLPAGAAKKIAEDLAKSAGKCVIAVGSRQPAELHALAAVLNEALGNVGKTVSYIPQPARPSYTESIAQLCSDLNSGAAETLVIIGGNPVYTAPADLKFDAALAKAKASIHLSIDDNETSQKCTWHVNRAHFLECWGDVRAYNGLATIQQPLISPLYNGWSTLDLLLFMLNDTTRSGYDVVRETFRTKFAGDDVAWEKALHDGLIANSAPKPATPNVTGAAWATALAEVAKGAGNGAFDVVFAPDHKVYDGRFANLGWLQELPDPVTKLTWDNAACISYADREKLGVSKNGDTIKVEVGGSSLVLPAFVVPGHAAGAITLTLGYAREFAGTVARGVGFNTYELRKAAGWHATSGNASAASGFHELAGTQDHHAVETKITNERQQEVIVDLVREQDLIDFTKKPDGMKHAGHYVELRQLFLPPTPYDRHKWGMAIDLAACTGCSACVVACQAENNIPVVGKAEVLRGREMHWIRIDRYFKGLPEKNDEIKVVFQPLPCQHCENAPCEQVCPVAATVHDTEGLNVMVYNRCVGTRYCANNCPFKVRRFNWFYNHNGPKHPRGRRDLTDIEKMGMNPDVTVRSRGVMEKCSYCVQRINQAKIATKNDEAKRVTAGQIAAIEKEAVHIPDGTIISACQQVCPTGAITFGDLNDPNSRVSKLQAHARSYSLLEEINVRPRTQYLTRLRNTGASLAKADHGGHAPHHEGTEGHTGEHGAPEHKQDAAAEAAHS